MTAPSVQAYINFSTGPQTAQAMILDTGILDTNILADAVQTVIQNLGRYGTSLQYAGAIAI